MENLRDMVIKIRTPIPHYPVISSIAKRFSPRVFLSKPIPQSDIESLFEAARLAPSSRYHQPWFFYVIRSKTSAFEKILTCVPERNLWIRTAPVIIISCYDPTEPKDGVNRWAQYDLGAAVMSLVLQATELGYHCRQVGSFDIVKVKNEFSIPEPLLPYTLIALGNIGSDEEYKQADPDIVQKDMTPNPRKEKIYEMIT